MAEEFKCSLGGDRCEHGPDKHAGALRDEVDIGRWCYNGCSSGVTPLCKGGSRSLDERNIVEQKLMNID